MFGVSSSIRGNTIRDTISNFRFSHSADSVSVSHLLIDLASLCEKPKAIAKTVSCVVLFQFYCLNICSLTLYFIQNNFKNILSLVLIGLSKRLGQRTKFRRLVVYLVVRLFVLKWESYLLV
jgi:hypothetical protein